MTDKSKENAVKKSATSLYSYLADGVGFISQKAFGLRSIYFPLCGIDATSVKSSITPRLSGDIKTDKDHYLTKPVSVEDLRQNVRNFFCLIRNWGVVSLASGSGEDAVIEAGMLWHQLRRTHKEVGIEMEALNFVPVSDGAVELMRVRVKNTSGEDRNITPTFCLPMFARALSNKHDHEHVTSLLNRIEQAPYGVCVEPTMVFNERGHKANGSVYYVLGVDGQGREPSGTFPTAESFYGEGGDGFAPEAVMKDIAPVKLPKEQLNGKEAMGALRFDEKTLAPGEACEYLIVMGVSADPEETEKTFRKYDTSKKFDAALQENESYWQAKTKLIEFKTGDTACDHWMRWVTLQPVLRRIFGCSFLPDHDYGKGGRGWRDIWQDLLSLILIEPENIRDTLTGNFAGVRIDGSNATIVGATPGEFIADRNKIARVWMDHGVWPFSTLLLYVNQTGDYDILLEENTYFCDAQLSRTLEKDRTWVPEKGNILKDRNNNTHKGSVIEHILIQHLAQFFNVGEHNMIRLEDADWNDGFDMARDRGESVAFSCYYAGNLLALAGLLEDLASVKGISEISLSVEVKILLDSLYGQALDYDNAQAKRERLIKTYFPSVQLSPSGEKENIALDRIARDLRKKGHWLFEHIRANEKVSVDEKGTKNIWFNGYYDNKSARVEGKKDGRVRMTLTGQVFPVMSGLANDDEIAGVIRSVNTYLRDERLGGVRLNTDFNVPHYLDLGRAFGFAYGTKENGAFFNHMSVMYAYALYKRGFAREGYDVLNAIYRMSIDTDRSKIYPGVPEYFDSEGRGRYHFLTGSASWLVLVKLAEVFGIRGEKGDLRIAPKLVKEEFDAAGNVNVVSQFAGKRVFVCYENPQKLDFGSYRIKEVTVNGKNLETKNDRHEGVLIERGLIANGPDECQIKVGLGD